MVATLAFIVPEGQHRYISIEGRSSSSPDVSAALSQQIFAPSIFTVED